MHRKTKLPTTLTEVSKQYNKVEANFKVNQIFIGAEGKMSYKTKKQKVKRYLN